jgi:uncharacterized membrane protein
MEYFTVLFLHVFSAIFWAGAGIAMGFFVVPAVMEAGPPAGAVMLGIVKRKFPVIMLIAGVVVVLTGLRLFMFRFTTEWLATPEGLVLSLGALLGLSAFGIGVFIQKPVATRMSVLVEQVAKQGGPPSPAQASEIQALRQRLGRIATISAWHLLGAALLMAIHRLAAQAS